MLACDSPQYSAHWPSYRPGSSASSLRWWTLPGTRSCLPARRGTQKEWITSTDSIVTYTGCPAGMCISLAVTTSISGYWTSNQNWCPMTRTSRAPAGLASSEKIVAIVGTAIAASRTAGAIVHMISRRRFPCTCSGTRSSSSPRSRNRMTATTIRPSTRTNTAVAIQNTGRNRASIWRAYGPAGSRESCGAFEAQEARKMATTASRPPVRQMRRLDIPLPCASVVGRGGSRPGPRVTISPPCRPPARRGSIASARWRLGRGRRRPRRGTAGPGS